MHPTLIRNQFKKETTEIVLISVFKIKMGICSLTVMIDNGQLQETIS